MVLLVARWGLLFPVDLWQGGRRERVCEMVERNLPPDRPQHRAQGQGETRRVEARALLSAAPSFPGTFIRVEGNVLAPLIRLSDAR